MEKEKAARAEIESGDTKKRKAEQDKAGADNIRRLERKGCLRLKPGKVMWEKLLQRRKKQGAAHMRCLNF